MEASKLAFLGEKIRSKVHLLLRFRYQNHVFLQIREFLGKGSIQECGESPGPKFYERIYQEINLLETIRASDRFKSLSTFTTVYGVGPKTARDLYDIGLRTIEDMERYYDVPTGGAPSAIQEGDILTPNGRRVPRTTRLPDISIQVALFLRHDLEVKIPRAEVEEIHAVVMSELGELQEGCVSMIVGGWVKYFSCHWASLGIFIIRGI
jgi:hypothetical protein